MSEINMDRVVRPERNGQRLAGNAQSKSSTKPQLPPCTADANGTSGYSSASVLALALEGDDDVYGEASYSPTGSATQHNQQSLAGVASTICPDLTHSAEGLTPEETVTEDEDNVDEGKDSTDMDEVAQPITASTEEWGELVIGHRVGCIAKIIDDGELVIGVSLGYIPKAIDDGELAIGALRI